MTQPTSTEASEAAQALAYVVAGRGFLDVSEAEALERLGAFQALGLDRARFAALVARWVTELDGATHEHSWIPASIETSFDEVLDAVTDTRQRALVCRFVQAVLRGTEPPDPGERLLVEHMMARWRSTHAFDETARPAGNQP